MSSKRKFSDEYKREAAQMASQPGVTKSQVGRELGINANLLERWCRGARNDCEPERAIGFRGCSVSRQQ